jgi:hypothetical protein
MGEMRKWSAFGHSLHINDELVALLTFEPCPYTDSWDELDDLAQFIADALNEKEQREAHISAASSYALKLWREGVSMFPEAGEATVDGGTPLDALGPAGVP